MGEVTFRDYQDSDKLACLAFFDANCPEFFAPNERGDYLRFLDSSPVGYKVCVVPGGLAGAFGVFPQAGGFVSLNWVLLDPAAQGLGIGSAIMAQVIASARSYGAQSMQIAASHKSATFFEKFGAVREAIFEHGWGADMHRVDMVLPL